MLARSHPDTSLAAHLLLFGFGSLGGGGEDFKLSQQLWEVVGELRCSQNRLGASASGQEPKLGKN